MHYVRSLAPSVLLLGLACSDSNDSGNGGGRDAGADLGVADRGGSEDLGAPDAGDLDSGDLDADLGTDQGADTGDAEDGGTMDAGDPDGGRPTTRRVNVHTDGTEANNLAWSVDVSADGRYVVFHSDATNLAAADTDNLADIFIRDTVEKTTSVVSVSSEGAKGDSTSRNPEISPDGRFVVFESNAANLVGGDDNNRQDVFRRDLGEDVTVRVSPNDGHRSTRGASLSNDGRFVAYYQANERLSDGTDIIRWDGTSGMRSTMTVRTGGGDADFAPSQSAISGDGRYVVFVGSAADIDDTDPNRGFPQVFRHDTMSTTTTIVSRGIDGTLANATCNNPGVSDDGRYVSFYTRADNLVEGDTNDANDVFVYDVQNGSMARVSVDSAGVEGNDGSSISSLSSDGRTVAFESAASNLVSGDGNGARDIFVKDLDTGVTTRVSPPGDAAEANGDSYEPRLCPAANCVVYRSAATNLVADDTNDQIDAFLTILP